jgi:hypothetical protein
MKINYYEDKVPHTVYGTLDSVWVNKASKCISFYVKVDNGVTVTIPIYTGENVILPHYMVTRIMTTMRDNTTDEAIQLEDIAMEILTQNTLGCFCNENYLTDNFFDMMIEDGYLTHEECQTFEFVHDRDVEDYERIMSEDTDEYENYGDYDIDDEDIDILDDSEQFPLINTNDKCTYNVYFMSDDNGIYIPNCINEPHITVGYIAGNITRVDMVFTTTDFGNAEISIECGKRILVIEVLDTILGIIADAKENGTSVYINKNIFE